MFVKSEDELLRLANDYMEGTASASQLQHLNQWLRTSPEARQTFIELVHLDSALADSASATVGQQAAEDDLLTIGTSTPAQPVTPAWFASPLQLVIGGAVAAAILGIVMLGTNWIFSAPGYATVARSLGVKALSDGDRVGRHTWSIDTGTLELLTDRGARIVIEAPADFRFESEARLHLTRGRLTADVPDQARGFCVITPSGEAVDLGTRFAMDVVNKQESELHVFEGEVVATAKGSRLKQHMWANSAVRFRKNQLTEECDFRQGTFVTAREVSTLAEALRQGQSRRALRASQALRQDPALLAWLDFDEDPNDALDDESVSPPQVHIHGARWVQGRFPGTGALDFIHSDDHVELNLNAHVPAFTLMTWIRANQSEGRRNSIYSTDEWGRLGQVHWMIGDDHRIRFAIKGPLSSDQLPLDPSQKDQLPNDQLPNDQLQKGQLLQAQAGEIDTNIWLETERGLLTEFERWMHLALVYDSELGRATQYLDGRVVAQAAMPKGLKATLGSAQLGNWKPASKFTKDPRRRLSARLDEFSAFSRALSGDEIRQYYQDSTPYR
ncbi:MAG: FecR domain-containing protein [Pirellulaceae bacterium]|nr:FecR domain-containing protein [Pirellulaceae bacterium]